MRCAIKESSYRWHREATRLLEDKGDKPTSPFRAREGRVKVAVFVIGLVLLFIGLIGALYGWFIASSLEATHAFTCTSSPPTEPYPGWCAALLSSARSGPARGRSRTASAATPSTRRARAGRSSSLPRPPCRRCFGPSRISPRIRRHGCGTSPPAARCTHVLSQAPDPSGRH